MAWIIKSAEDYKQTHQAIQRMFDQLAERMNDVLVQTIQDCLVSTLKKSVMRTPIDEGSLRKSAFVEINGLTVARGEANGTVNVLMTYTPGDGRTMQYEAVIGYGAPVPGAGDIDSYAYVQHEHLEFNHPKGGQAKFLQSAVIEDIDTWGELIVKDIRSQLGGGV